MLTPDEIMSTEFAKAAMGGYKIDHVAEFLAEVADFVRKLQAENSEQNSRIAGYEARIAQYQKDETSIHTTMLNAQRLADQVAADVQAECERKMALCTSEIESIKDEAEKEAKLLRERTKFDTDELTRVTEETSARMLADAEKRAAAITGVAEDAVKNQQNLFDEMKLRVADFRQALLLQYQSHLDVIETIPNEVPENAEVRAKMAAGLVDEQLAAQTPIMPAAEFEAVPEEAFHTEPEVTPEPESQTDAADPWAADEPEDAEAEIVAQETPAPAAEFVPDEAETKPGPKKGYPMTEEKPAEPVKKGGFKVRVDDDDDDEEFAPAGASFDEIKKDDNGRGDEQAGFGFFKKK